MITTLAQAKAAFSWSTFTNLCSNDPRLTSLLNEAVMRLRPKGLWVGTMVEYAVCTSKSCATWPRQIETIEAAWICDRPLTLRNAWYQALPNGLGRVRPGQGTQLVDREGWFVTHTDLVIPRKIALFSATLADAGKLVLLQGRDDNANWVLTGTVDGEQVALVNGYKVTNTIWSPPGLTGVQKAATIGPVRAYSVLDTCPSGVVADISAFDPIAIAYWEPDETLPSYRRSILPFLPQTTSDDTDCTQTQIVVLAKLQFVKAIKDTDYLQIGNLPALKEEVQSILLGERGMLTESLAHEARAVQLLQEELSSHEGHGVVQPFKVEDTAIFGAGGIGEVYYGSYNYPPN